MSATRGVSRYAVIFDGGCPLCRRWIARLKRWDAGETLEMVTAQDPSISVRFPWIDAPALDQSVHVVRLADGTTWRGAAAIEELLRIHPGGRSIRPLFRLPFARSVAEKIYRIIARNRHFLGCEEHCRTN